MAETEISAYTSDDILRILGLTNPTVAQVQSAARELAARMEVAGKPQLALFFKQAEEKVVSEMEKSETPVDAQDDPTTQLGQWWEYQYLKQADAQQAEIPADRREKVQMFDDTHNLLKRERLGVRNTVQVPVAQGTINPTLRNLHTKLVLIDSQFRQTIEAVGAGAGTSIARTQGVYNSTDYTVDLSEPLRNVVSMELWQVQIPVSWYAFSCARGNTTYSIGNQICVRTIAEGNYTLQDILDGNMIGTIESIDTTTDTTDSSIPAPTRASSCGATGATGGGALEAVDCVPGVTNTQRGGHVLCFSLGGPNKNRLVNTSNVDYVFFRPKIPLGVGEQCGACPPNTRINQNLGWSLGFRPGPDGRIVARPNVPADAAYDLFGPKYFVVVLDDFNNSRTNQGIVSTVNSQTLRQMPGYATQPGFGTDSVFPSRSKMGSFTADQNARGVCRYKKQDPRQFTTAQLYTMNSILDERDSGGTSMPAQNARRVEGPTASDSLCIIPLEGSEIYQLRRDGLARSTLTTNAESSTSSSLQAVPGTLTTDPSPFAKARNDPSLLGGGAPYTKFGSQLQTRKREYFGPVNIDRVRVKLVDDKGQPVDLNGLDWAISLNVDMLYQY